jgi:hypothetical protein
MNITCRRHFECVGTGLALGCRRSPPRIAPPAASRLRSFLVSVCAAWRQPRPPSPPNKRLLPQQWVKSTSAKRPPRPCLRRLTTVISARSSSHRPDTSAAVGPVSHQPPTTSPLQPRRYGRLSGADKRQYPAFACAICFTNCQPFVIRCSNVRL